MQLTKTGKKFTLSDRERDALKRTAILGGYVGTVQFRGPRVRVYRGIRTAVFMTAERALDEADAISKRRYAHGARATEMAIYRINFLGYVEEQVA